MAIPHSKAALSCHNRNVHIISWQPITHVSARTALKDATQKKEQFPDSLQRALDICAKAIIVIPAGSFFISICSNVAFFAGLGVGMSSIPVSIYDFIMAFRMWFAIFILLCVFSFISFKVSKFISYIILTSLDYIFIASKSKFICGLLKFLKTTVSKKKIQAGDLLFSIILVCFMSFLKGASYAGNQGNVYVKQDNPKQTIETLDGSIIALDKGIVIKQCNSMIMFIFNENIIKIEYKIYQRSFSEKLLDLL